MSNKSLVEKTKIAKEIHHKLLTIKKDIGKNMVELGLWASKVQKDGLWKYVEGEGIARFRDYCNDVLKINYKEVERSIKIYKYLLVELKIPENKILEAGIVASEKATIYYLSSKNPDKTREIIENVANDTLQANQIDDEIEVLKTGKECGKECMYRLTCFVICPDHKVYYPEIAQRLKPYLKKFLNEGQNVPPKQ